MCPKAAAAGKFDASGRAPVKVEPRRAEFSIIWVLRVPADGCPTPRAVVGGLTPLACEVDALHAELDAESAPANAPPMQCPAACALRGASERGGY
jgi:hypothetical protein